MNEHATTCGDVRRYYLRDDFVRYLFDVLPKRSVVLCAASEPTGRYQQCRPRLAAVSPQTLTDQITSWLDSAFSGLADDEVPPVYPSLHYAVHRYWQGGRDWVIEADADEWQEAWKAMEPVVGLVAALEIPYTLRYTGHCSPHLCLAGENFPEPSGLLEALSVSEGLAHRVGHRLEELAARHSHANVHFTGGIARLPYTLNENTGLACIVVPPALYDSFDPSYARPETVTISPLWPPTQRSRRAGRLIEWATGQRDLRPTPVRLFSRSSSAPMPSASRPQVDFQARFRRLRDALRLQMRGRSPGRTGAPAPPEGMAYVPASPFISSSSWPVDGKAWAALELGKPAMAIAETGEYFMDICPVTNSQYASFVRAGAYDQEQLWSKDGWHFVRTCRWRGPLEPLDPEKPDLPVGGVSHFEAEAYARWCGKRLPTRGEWEKACRGTDGRRWPWGDEFDETLCNTADSRRPGEDWLPTPVGAYPSGASRYGCLDMVGNIWEWTRDAMVIGGSFNSHIRECNGCVYHGQEPHYRPDKVGFRCVRDVIP